MKLIEQIQNEKHEQKQSALIRYYKWLTKIDVNNPTDEDRTTLEEILSASGKSLDDFVRDRPIALSVGQLIDQVANTAHAQADHGPAHERYMAACAERQRMHQEQNAKVTAAMMEAEQLRADMDTHNTGKRQLRDLRINNPHLYAAIVEPNEKKLRL